MDHRPERCAGSEADGALAASPPANMAAPAIVAGGEPHRVEQAVHEVHVVDQAGEVRAGEALDARAASSCRPSDFGDLRRARRARPSSISSAGTSSPARKSRCADERPGIGVVDLDRDAAQPLATGRRPARAAAARTGRSASSCRPARRGRRGRGPRSTGRPPRRRSRAASRRRRAGRARAPRWRARRGSCPAWRSRRRRAAAASSASAVSKAGTPEAALEMRAHLRRRVGHARDAEQLGQVEEVRQVLDLRDEPAADDADVRSLCMAVALTASTVKPALRAMRDEVVVAHPAHRSAGAPWRDPARPPPPASPHSRHRAGSSGAPGNRRNRRPAR